MDRYAIFVDAGYFFAAGGTAALGESARHKIDLINPEKCIASLIQQGKELTGNDRFLRIYWYDAIRGNTPTILQSTIAHLQGVKLRLGVVNSYGEQKGVDSLIVTDLIDLARNGAVADAVLIAGDEDLRVAVQVAQSYGVRVHLLSAGNPKFNVSQTLQMEVDTIQSFSIHWLQTYFSRVQSLQNKEETEACPAMAENVPVEGGKTLEEASNSAIGEILTGVDLGKITQLAAHFQKNQTVPSDYDRRLMACCRRHLGKPLEGAEKRRLRGMFITTIRKMTDKSSRIDTDRLEKVPLFPNPLPRGNA